MCLRESHGGDHEAIRVINDATRIKETLPTLRLLIDKGAKIILAAHLGRPKGKREPSMSLRPVADKLSEMLGRPVAFVDDCIGETAEKAVAALKPGDLLLLENVRYLQRGGGQRSRPSPKNWRAWPMSMSTTPLARPIAPMPPPKASPASSPGAAASAPPGLLMERELKFLGQELENPARPFVVILGGAKVSDKIKVIDRLLEKADTILIGGAMAYTFKLALGHKVGKSLVRTGQTGRGPRRHGKGQGPRRPIPAAHRTTSSARRWTPASSTRKASRSSKFKIRARTTARTFPTDAEGLGHRPGHGPALRRNHPQAKTIMWNGPMGMFEDARFAEGTNAVARAVAEATASNGAKSIIGGGDSVKALNQAGLGDKVTFMSTGGGASLEFLEGRVLPGVAALSDKMIQAIS